MRRDLALLVCAGLVAGAGRAPAQATGTPTFNAPYRAFQRSEIGLLLSFPNGGGTAVEGAYRMASGRLDLGFRVGFFDPPGRRIDPQGSTVSIVPYVQPTLYLLAGDTADHVQFSLGLGADFRLSRAFDARLSAGLGDNEGVSIGAVWVH